MNQQVVSSEGVRRALMDALAERDSVVLSRINDLSRQVRTGLAGLGKSKAELSGHDKFVKHAAYQLWRGGSSSRSIADAHAHFQTQQRGVVSPASTTVPTWAQELVGTDVADFLASGSSPNIYGQLSGYGIRIDPVGAIRIPARMPGPASGAFVGESQAIPVARLNLSSAMLRGGRKTGAISNFSEELRAASMPSIESILESQLSFDLGRVIDAQLLSDLPGTAIAPPGLRFGVAALPPAAGTDPKANVEADLKALIAAVVAAGGTRPLVIANPVDAISIAFLQGQFLVPVLQSINQPVGTIIAVDAASFASMIGSAEIAVSDQVALHENDAPLPIIGGVPASPVLAVPVRSAFQTATASMRVLVDNIDWVMVQPNVVSWVEAIQW